MIELYTWGTPNGFKPVIMLEETALPYRLHPIDLQAGAQKTPGYLAINPNGKIPAMTDDADGERIVMSESGAILIYLAEKSGQFMPGDRKGRFAVMQWLMFQLSAVGPMFGQLAAFSRAEVKVQPAIDKFRAESARVAGVLEQHLAQQAWLASAYSIADMSTFTWVRAADFIGFDLAPYPALRRWRDRIAERPAVQRALAVFETT